jgi:hypothetical protein
MRNVLIEVLASGLLGALIATILGIAFSFFQEQARVRADVMLTVVGWADDTYLRIIDLRTSKKAAYTSDKPYLAAEEYAANSRELRSLLLRASVPARLAIVYGEGEETLLLNQLRDRLLTAARKLWGSKKENWSAVDADIQVYIAKEVDPIREQLERKLLEKGSIPMMWLRLKRKIKEGPNWSGLDTDDT